MSGTAVICDSALIHYSSTVCLLNQTSRVLNRYNHFLYYW